MGSARARASWLYCTAATLPVSYLLWWFWGSAFCGEEDYDTSTADALCDALVEPVWPMALVAATPTLVALVGGFIGLRLRNPRLFRFSMAAPFALGVLTFFLAPALF